MPPKFKRSPDSSGSSNSERRNLLAPDSDEEDFFVSSEQPGGGGTMQKLQGQVSEVVSVMQENIGKVMERGDKLSDLQDKSENLSTSADQFRIRARNVRNTMWWRECKMKIIVALVVILVIAVIIIPIVIKYHRQ